MVVHLIFLNHTLLGLAGGEVSACVIIVKKFCDNLRLNQEREPYMVKHEEKEHNYETCVNIAGAWFVIHAFAFRV